VWGSGWLLGWCIIYGLPRLTKTGALTLVAIVGGFGVIRRGWQLPGAAGGRSGPNFLEPGTVFFAIRTITGFLSTALAIILPTALAISFVGLLQSFLTGQCGGRAWWMEKTSDYGSRSQAQGIRPTIGAGLFGGMAGAA